MNMIKQIQTAISNQLGKNGMRRSDQLATRRADANFARRHPDSAAAYFVEQFLVRHAAGLPDGTPDISRGSKDFELATEFYRSLR